MSFGFGVGDVIAVSGLARTIWGRFRDSSDQLHAIQTEVAGLCIVLDDIATHLPGHLATKKQIDDLAALMRGCRSVLTDCEDLLRKKKALASDSPGLGSRGKKAWSKLTWDAAAVNELRDRMVSNATYLNAFNTGLASEVSRATNDKIDVVAENIQSLRLNQNNQEREAVLEWLSSFDFASMQSELSGRRQTGTGSWLLDSQEYRDWASEAGNTLVCQGIPGAGKTMLASLVIDRLQHPPNDEPTAIAYIYCDYRRQTEQTPINLLASLTKQLLRYQDPVPKDTMKLHQRHEKGSRPSLEEVLDMATSSMLAMSRVYIVIDALDELGNAGLVRQTLTSSLRQLQVRSHFNLMTTSRYIPSLAQEFYQPICMDIKASPADIRRYVEAHILDLPSCVKKKVDLQKLIADTIVDVVEGMFLLARLHMDSLRDKTSPNAIKKALRDLPTGSNTLDLAYDGAMQRIDSQLQGFRDSAKQLLGWLTYSQRLMTVREVLYALAIEPGTPDFDEDNLGDVDEIIAFCAGLVNIDGETQILRLVHYTTQDYFRRNSDKLQGAQRDIAVSCLTYLLYEDFEDGWDFENVWDFGAEQALDEESHGSGEDGSIMQEEEEAEVEQEEEAAEEGEKREGNLEGDHEITNDQGLAEESNDYLDSNDSDVPAEMDIPNQEMVQARIERYPFLEYAARYWAVHASVRKEPIVRDLLMSFVKDYRKVSSASQVVFVLDESVYLIEAINATRSHSPFSASHALAYLGYSLVYLVYDGLMPELLDQGFPSTNYPSPSVSDFRNLRYEVDIDSGSDIASDECD